MNEIAPHVAGYDWDEPGQGCWFCAVERDGPFVALLVGVHFGSGHSAHEEIPVVCCREHRPILQDTDAEALKRLLETPYAFPVPRG